jgi:thiol-disulfide isomerase/thioredoxin
VTSNTRRVVLGCAVALVVAGCGAAHATTAPLQQVTASGGPTLTGKDVSITSFRGHPVVLIFWASWCGPCHDEQPALNTAYATWKSRGVAFLGIDLRDTTTPALAFQSEFKVPYPSIADTNATLAVNYQIPSAPALVFLNRQGKVADVVLGALGTMSDTEFNAEITSLLGASKTGSA